MHVTGHEYDGGIIITASHLPFNRNGFKFFTKDGGLEKGDIKDVLQRAAAAAHSAGMSPGARHSDDALVLDAALNIDPSSTPKASICLLCHWLPSNVFVSERSSIGPSVGVPLVLFWE